MDCATSTLPSSQPASGAVYAPFTVLLASVPIPTVQVRVDEIGHITLYKPELPILLYIDARPQSTLRAWSEAPLRSLDGSASPVDGLDLQLRTEAASKFFATVPLLKKLHADMFWEVLSLKYSESRKQFVVEGGVPRIVAEAGSTRPRRYLSTSSLFGLRYGLHGVRPALPLDNWFMRASAVFLEPGLTPPVQEGQRGSRAALPVPKSTTALRHSASVVDSG
ncbi:hypothetical protein HPB51_014036 [Rhipicephalus microplus]|uniref:Uncharacterized protein n=1 Tax=Rhipicephalus microplus TaxID=6941 RepID=A0A9J6EAR6_RHIMP|nr:hypothetical protein HPB51_014036 [Rhipicephalus microplus]